MQSSLSILILLASLVACSPIPLVSPEHGVRSRLQERSPQPQYFRPITIMKGWFNAYQSKNHNKFNWPKHETRSFEDPETSEALAQNVQPTRKDGKARLASSSRNIPRAPFSWYSSYQSKKHKKNSGSRNTKRSSEKTQTQTLEALGDSVRVHYGPEDMKAAFPTFPQNASKTTTGQTAPKAWYNYFQSKNHNRSKGQVHKKRSFTITQTRTLETLADSVPPVPEDVKAAFANAR